MADMRDIALGYIKRGWNPVPVPFRQKGPKDDRWHQRVINAENASQYFNGVEANIGIQLGPKSGGLTDVDLDCEEAVAIAPYVLPKTTAAFGRPSKRASHWLYVTNLWNGAKTVYPYDNPIIDRESKKKRRLVELRCGGEDKGTQTVFPGSVHEEGEPITWDSDGEPIRVDGEFLHRRVLDLAAYSLLAQEWPRVGSGTGHECGLVLGGFLSRLNKTPDQIKTIATAITRAAGDTKWQNRVSAAVDAAEAHRQGDNAHGFPSLVRMFGKDVSERVAEWLGYQHQGAEIDFMAGVPVGDQAACSLTIKSSKDFVAGFVPPDYTVGGLLQQGFLYSLSDFFMRNPTTGTKS